jgi:uncharacterized protein YhaN
VTAEHGVAEPDVDVAAVQHLITEALGATSALPSRARLVELDEQLRAELDRLVPAVRKMAEAAPHRSREWHRLQNELDRAVDALAPRLPDGPLAASLHVAELARRACALRQIEGEHL